MWSSCPRSLPGIPEIDLLAGCTLGWTLLALSWIDWRHWVLPNSLTLPLILLGLARAWFINSQTMVDRAAGAIVGYIALTSLAAAYRMLRGRHGLGAGDAKLLAAGGAWTGWQVLPTITLVAALTGIAIALVQRARGGALLASTALPFGPCLSLAIWVVWLLGR